MSAEVRMDCMPDRGNEVRTAREQLAVRPLAFLRTKDKNATSARRSVGPHRLLYDPRKLPTCTFINYNSWVGTLWGIPRLPTPLLPGSPKYKITTLFPFLGFCDLYPFLGSFLGSPGGSLEDPKTGYPGPQKPPFLGPGSLISV